MSGRIEGLPSGIGGERRVFCRVMSPELMDDPALEAGRLRAALDGLARLNTLSLAPRALWSIVAEEARRAGRKIRVLDVACARGDWVIGAATKAARTGVRAEFSGCDINPQSIEMAREGVRRGGIGGTFFVRDAVRGEDFGDYDVVVASLFLHHLSEGDAVALLARMGSAARRLVVVNDLVRSRLNIGMVAAASRVLSSSPIVHTDAVRSVRAAFTRAELLGLAARAGLGGAVIRAGGFGRVLLVRRRKP